MRWTVLFLPAAPSRNANKCMLCERSIHTRRRPPVRDFCRYRHAFRKPDESPFRSAPTSKANGGICRQAVGSELEHPGAPSNGIKASTGQIKGLQVPLCSPCQPRYSSAAALKLIGAGRVGTLPLSRTNLPVMTWADIIWDNVTKLVEIQQHYNGAETKWTKIWTFLT